jgi:hypothetical protein
MFFTIIPLLSFFLCLNVKTQCIVFQLEDDSIVPVVCHEIGVL